MKKLLVLVSCFAVLLVFSNVNFVQAEDVADAPCSCCTCTAAPMVPFAYPPFAPPAPKFFGGRHSAFAPKYSFGLQCPLASKCPRTSKGLVAPAPVVAFPQTLPMPVQPAAFPYAAAPSARPLAARRAARQAAQPAMPFPFPPPAMAAPPVFAPGPDVAPVAFSQYPAPATQMGDLNRVKVGGTPTINFMSIVRSPRAPYDPYAAYYYYQQAYPQPEAAVAP